MIEHFSSLAFWECLLPIAFAHSLSLLLSNFHFHFCTFTLSLSPWQNTFPVSPSGSAWLHPSNRICHGIPKGSKSIILSTVINYQWSIITYKIIRIAIIKLTITDKLIMIMILMTKVTGQGESGKFQADQLLIMTSVLLPFLARHPSSSWLGWWSWSWWWLSWWSWSWS